MVTQNILISLFDFRISFAISKGDILGIPSIESVRCITYRANSFNPFKQNGNQYQHQKFSADLSHT